MNPQKTSAVLCFHTQPTENEVTHLPGPLLCHAAKLPTAISNLIVLFLFIYSYMKGDSDETGRRQGHYLCNVLAGISGRTH